MLDRIRRGYTQVPSGQFHGTSFNIAAVGLRAFIAGAVSVRLSALLAFAVVVWMLVANGEVDPTKSALLITMTSFTWQASAQLAWFRGR
ncbi:hypothetical protein CIB93_00915 [Streptomyces sp. WZ.A104]|nr:hypothetical protein CIB93_00915 [Streptomyces sp. WZ.A104]